MRFAYSAHAVSAQAGSLALTARTRSLATCALVRRRLLRTRLLRRRRPLELDRLAAPDFLEVVEVAHRRMHDVHDHIAQVDQHPFAVRLALDAVDARTALAQLLLHVVGERLDLPRRVAARDHHALEHR